MTRTTNARIAGAAFLLYIVAGLASLALAGRTPVTVILTQFTDFMALALGVTLYAITRDEDADLALFALTCRVIEAGPGGEGVGALFFAVGSAVFCWLLLRGRMIPAALARLGLIASLLLVVMLPLQRAGMLGGPMNWAASATWLTWLPMLAFELAIAVWFLIYGVAKPARQLA